MLLDKFIIDLIVVTYHTSQVEVKSIELISTITVLLQANQLTKCSYKRNYAPRNAMWQY